MKSRFFQLSIVCLVMTFSLSAFAQFKIAVVNVEQAIFETEDGTAEQAAWEEEDRPEVERLTKLQEDITSLQNKLRTDRDILSQQELSDIQDEIEGKTSSLQAGAQLYQQTATRRQNAFMRNMTPRFNTVLQDLIDIEGYDLVLRNNLQAQNFLYINPKHDITRKITERLNERTDEELPEELTELEEANGAADGED